MRILLRFVGPVATTICLGACAAPAAAPLVPAPPSSPASTPSPPLVAEPSVEPGELRCGLDDGPVPVGRQDEDDLREAPGKRFVADAPRLVLRDGGVLGIRLVAPRPPPLPVEAAPPWPAARWSLGEGLAATPAFTRRADGCAVSPNGADVGDHGFTVRFRDDGRAFAVKRLGRDHAPSALLSCFAAALCETARAAASSTNAMANASLVVKLMPPVFSGSARFTTVEDSRGLQNRDGSPTGRKVPRRGPFSEAEHQWHDGLGKMLEKGTLACARARPPEGAVRFMVRLPYDPRRRKFSTELAGRTAGNAFERQLQQCFADAAVSALLPPPAGLVPNGAVTLMVDITPEPPNR